MAGDHLAGVTKSVILEETITVPSAAGAREYSFPDDFNVNYMVLDFNATDITTFATIAEKNTKIGTFDIKTKGSVGQWITGLDFDDFYYWYQAKYLQGGLPFLVGEGGGDLDISAHRVILDAGCGLNISSKCAWSPEMAAKLRIVYGVDAAANNWELNIRWVGYKGSPPNRVAGIKSLTPTFTSGQEVDVEPESGDILSEFFGFLTTELDLATLQAKDAPTLEELRIYNGKKLETSFDVFTMIDGIDNTDDGNLGQYVYLNLDRMMQGLGYSLDGKPKIQYKAGTAADAARLYLKLLEKV